MLFADSISSCLTLEFPAFVIAVCRTLNPLESSPGYNPIADRKNFAKFFYWIIFLKLTFKILLLKLLTAPKIRFVFPFALCFFFFASQLMCCKQCRVAQLPFLLQFHQTTTNCLFSEFFCVLWHTSPSLSVFLALHFYDNSSVLIILIGVVISIIASSRSGNKNYSGYHGGILGSFIGKK